MSINVSIVVPIFNSGNTLDDCVKSLINQDYCNIEIILVDDGSQDNSGDICDFYAQQDMRIRVVHQKNAGRSVAREVGVMKSVGEWVAFVDSDDKLPQTAISDLYKVVTDDVDIVMGNGYTLPNETRTVIPLEDFRHMAVRGEGTIGVPWGSLYRREILHHYFFDVPRSVYMGEDYIFWLRLIFCTEKPVNVVYKNVYSKGADTTSNSFVWTAEYAYLINELRKGAIPKDKHSVYLNDMLDDRIANLMAVVLDQPRKLWIDSDFYNDILYDMALINRKFSIRQKMFLAIPSLPLRKFCLKALNAIKLWRA